jgi:biotin carboxylase
MRASRALGELEVEGISTTRELFLEMLQDAPIREGRYTTGYLDEAAPRLATLGPGA